MTIGEKLDTLRMFWCLDKTVTLLSLSTIYNRIIANVTEIEEKLLEFLPGDTKVLITLDGWSANNRQSYMSIIGFFIDENWNWHQVLWGFEYMSGSHTGAMLSKVLLRTLRRHELMGRILAVTTDNAGNNKTMFADMVKHLEDLADFVGFVEAEQGDNDDDVLENEDAEVNMEWTHIANDNDSLVHIPCLAHVIQLALQALLGYVKIRPTNEELQKNWDEEQDAESVHSADRGLPMTLAKVG